jgi:ribosomal protein S12 methylthiotransferase
MAEAAAKTKVGFVSLGCPKNLVDSEVMMGLLERDGYEITPDADAADVLVVNTCAFIESAQRESVDAILEMAQRKQNGKAKRLIVAGCMVERFREQLRRELPEVDALIGTGELERIGAAAGGPSLPPGGLLPILPNDFFDARPAAPYLYDERTPRLRATAPHTAYVKIAEGCDHPCTFCVIPQYRGKFRSRQPASVEAEARRLAQEGARELVLIGQDTTCYGDDLGVRDGLAGLLARLAAVAHESESLRWIRTLYFYPNRVNQPLLDTLAAHAALCKYIDMPLQHASAAVLKRMRRGGSGEAFLRLLERMRATIPGVALRSTFIVGFPGETEAEFEELRQFVAAAELDWMGVFGYSDEDTNAASRLAGKVAPEVIERRRDELMRAQQAISRGKRQRQVGARLPILVEGPAEESDWLWQGRLETQAPEIDGKVLINDAATPEQLRTGEFAMVEITEAQDYDLVGRLV